LRDLITLEKKIVVQKCCTPPPHPQQIVTYKKNHYQFDKRKKGNLPNALEMCVTDNNKLSLEEKKKPHLFRIIKTNYLNRKKNLPSSTLWESCSFISNVGIAPSTNFFPLIRCLEKWSEHIFECVFGNHPSFPVNFTQASHSAVFGNLKNKIPLDVFWFLQNETENTLMLVSQLESKLACVFTFCTRTIIAG